MIIISVVVIVVAAKAVTVSVTYCHRSIFSQFKQLERRSVKKISASTGFEPVTSAIPGDALPTEL